MTSYDYPEKHLWRQWVWGHVDGSNGGHVLMMPDAEDGWMEVEEIRARGFSEDRIHCANLNTAIVASLKRVYPGINTYGGPSGVAGACKRIAAKGIRLAAANVDFCGNVCGETLDTVWACDKSGAIDGGLIFVNVLRGREDRRVRTYMRPSIEEAAALEVSHSRWWIANAGIDKPSREDIWRVVSLMRATGDRGVVARPYCTASGQSFLTVVFSPSCGAGALTGEEEELFRHLVASRRVEDIAA